MSFESIWRTMDERVASGLIPGYVAAVRIGGTTEIHAGGRRSIAPDSAPMTEDTLFRIASLTKQFGGVLTLSLVQDGVLALDDPVTNWLPEFANLRVLTDPDAELDSTVGLTRPMTVRHLLTMTNGWGAVLRDNPQQAAMIERGVYPGPFSPPMTGDEFVATLAGLPLAFQPGEGWLYDTGTDVLGVLLARATGKSVSTLVKERITAPLGLADTGFWTPHVDRLATAYRPTDDGLTVLDPPDGEFSRPPRFEELSSGLVATAADVLRFYCAMADGGGGVVTPESVTLMTRDALTDEVRAQAAPIVDPGASWGLATSVDLGPAAEWMAPGRWGWTGGTGTTAYVDPVRGTVSVLLTQRAMTGPQDGFEGFWTAVAKAA